MASEQGVRLMTLEERIAELRDALPAMVVWMAKEAVMEGAKAKHRHQEAYDAENKKEHSGQPYNYSIAHAQYNGVRVAAEVLWKLFCSCSADCQSAIEKVANKRDGYSGYADDYFDDFVIALEERLGGPIRIRTVE